jgi:hypothetical protein
MKCRIRRQNGSYDRCATIKEGEARLREGDKIQVRCLFVWRTIAEGKDGYIVYI